MLLLWLFFSIFACTKNVERQQDMLQLKALRSVDGKWRFERQLNLAVKPNQLACLTIPASSALLNAILAQAPAEGYISIDSERITPSTIFLPSSRMPK